MTDAGSSQPPAAPTGPTGRTRVAAAAVDGVRGEDDAVTSETLVEEVSTDGMCGGY
jgi:mycofactocin precursor